MKETAITQIALIVDDIDKYTAAWAKVFKVEQPKAFLTEGKEKTNMQYEGKPTDARAKLAFLHAQNITIEFIQPIGEGSIWMEHLKKHGPSVQHIALNAPDMKQTIDALGLPVSQTGDYTGGCYAYLRGQKLLGVDLELLHNNAK
jgi:hypothetical protein